MSPNPEMNPQEDTDETTEEENNNSSGKRVRTRKRKIYKTLSAQLEFYFSDANLSKSKYMIEILEKEGPWLPTELFLKFNKIKSLLKESFGVCTEEQREQSLKHLTSSLTKISSSQLEVSPDGLQVRRRIPFKGPASDEEERTLYVENLPAYANLESLSQLFSQFGPVDYISFPKYKQSQLPKGFAFVEFRGLESAQKALAAYGKEPPPEDKDPAELQSIKSFQIEQRASLLNQSEGGEDEASSSKEEEEEENDAQGEKSSKGGTLKKKRKRKKKDLMESEEDLQLMTLSIMSKTVWRRLRNKYLNLQRKNASQAKQRFRKMKEEATTLSKEEDPEKTKEDPDKTKEDPEKTKEDSEKTKEDSEAKKKPGSESLPFVPNTIVRCELEEMVGNPKAYKSRIQEALLKPVKYVDLGIGNRRFHIRCVDEEQATSLVQLKDREGLFSSEDNVVTSLTVLTGDEEVAYWKKIQKDRNDKRTGKVKTRPKKRGRDKLQEKMDVCVNTRIVFSND